jgi:hypothetical protein
LTSHSAVEKRRKEGDDPPFGGCKAFEGDLLLLSKKENQKQIPRRPLV